MRFVIVLVWLLCAPLGMPATAALAQNYPNRPIRIIAQFTPGTSTDILARVIGGKLSETWGQQVVVDNRPGAGGVGRH
jgi:tripartite-type tricarboxylate transporter receptor subunit TctC